MIDHIDSGLHQDAEFPENCTYFYGYFNTLFQSTFFVTTAQNVISKEGACLCPPGGAVLLSAGEYIRPLGWKLKFKIVQCQSRYFEVTSLGPEHTACPLI